MAGDDPRDQMDEPSSQVDQGFTQISSIRGAIDAARAVLAGQQRIIDLLLALIDRPGALVRWAASHYPNARH